MTTPPTITNLDALLEAIDLHCRPSTLAALYADLSACPAALNDGILDALCDSSCRNIGYDATKALFDREEASAA